MYKTNVNYTKILSPAKKLQFSKWKPFAGLYWEFRLRSFQFNCSFFPFLFFSPSPLHSELSFLWCRRQRFNIISYHSFINTNKSLCQETMYCKVCTFSILLFSFLLVFSNYLNSDKFIVDIENLSIRFPNLRRSVRDLNLIGSGSQYLWGAFYILKKIT